MVEVSGVGGSLVKLVWPNIMDFNDQAYIHVIHEASMINSGASTDT
jgi:hypothetical protein